MAWYKLNRRIFIAAAVVGILLFVQNYSFSQELPPPMPHPRIGMCSARIGDKLYLIGGAVQNMQGDDEQDLESVAGTSIVDAFNLDSLTWDTSIAPLGTPRAFATAVVLDDSIYVMGGVDSVGRVLNSVEVYDPTKNEWHFTADMLLHRKGAASVVYGDSILVFGGGDKLGILHSLVEAYTPATGVWVPLPDSTKFGRVYHHVVKVRNSIYIFGGMVGLGAQKNVNVGPFGWIERYIPGIGVVQINLTWRNPRAYFDIINRNDSVYTISGYGQATVANTNGYFPDVEILDFHVFDRETEVETGVKLVRPRAGFIAAQGVNDLFYIFGGISPSYKSGLVPISTVDVIPGSVSMSAVQGVSNNIPTHFELLQNYPNPFNPTTTIEFQVPSPGSIIRLDVYNMLGEKVKTLVNGHVNEGTSYVSFNGADMPSGAYIYRLQTESGSIYRKMVLMK